MQAKFMTSFRILLDTLKLLIDYIEIVRKLFLNLVPETFILEVTEKTAFHLKGS